VAGESGVDSVADLGMIRKEQAEVLAEVLVGARTQELKGFAVGPG
jgi:hypothetical protein